PQALSWETLQTVVQGSVTGSLNGHVRMAAGFYEMLASGVAIQECARVPLLTLRRLSITGLYGIAKSVLDVALALLLLIPGLPLMGLVTLGARLAGIQHIWQSQVMLGRMERPFRLGWLDVDKLRAEGPPWL